MNTIYVSNHGDDTNDGLTPETPVHSWRRLMTLCKGNHAMHLMEGDFTLLRLKAEIDEFTGRPLGKGRSSPS